MKKLLFGLLFALLPVLAHAESLVVQTCGANPQTYTPGATRLDTIDVNGNKCSNVGSGAPGSGNAGYPAGATPIVGASGNVAAATASAGLTGTAGKTTYICGFAITSSGSTAAAVVSPTISNTISGTLTYTYTSVAGVTLANAPLVVNFAPCIPAFGANAAITVSLPSLGAGNTNTTVNAWGFQQ